MGPLTKPRIFKGDGVIFMSDPDWKEQGPHQIRWGLWIPLFECHGEERKDLFTFLKKHHEETYDELMKQTDPRRCIKYCFD